MLSSEFENICFLIAKELFMYLYFSNNRDETIWHAVYELLVFFVAKQKKISSHRFEETNFTYREFRNLFFQIFDILTRLLSIDFRIISTLLSLLHFEEEQNMLVRMLIRVT